MSKPTKDQMASQIEDLRIQLDDMAVRLAVLEAANPHARRISLPDLRKLLEADPYAELEVLESATIAGQLYEAGRVVRADLFPRLADLVAAGLAVGTPVDMGAHVRQAMELAQAKREAAQAERDLAKAAASRVLAEQAAEELAG